MRWNEIINEGSEGAKKKHLKTIIDYIKANVPQALEVYLFGSRARSEGRRASDYDILVVCQDDTNATLRLAPLHLEQHFATSIDANFEIVNYKSWNNPSGILIGIKDEAKLLFKKP